MDATDVFFNDVLRGIKSETKRLLTADAESATTFLNRSANIS